MIKIAICDDEACHRETTTEYLERYFQQKSEEYQVEVYTSGRELLEQESPDILLLDIEMEPPLQQLPMGIQHFLNPVSRICTQEFLLFFL